MGEGGAVNIIRRPSLKSYAESFRDWGRDCWCPSGKDDTCGKRFQWQLGELPEGYDHKYIYSHLGYNLKPLDPQAAIGRVQLRRLPDFIQARKENWETLRRGLHGLEKYIGFSLPTHATAWLPPGEAQAVQGGQVQAASTGPSDFSATASSPLNLNSPDLNSSPSALNLNSRNLNSCFQWDSTGNRSGCSWFGFKITVKPDAPFTRTDLASHLDQHRIGNRMLFGGNLIRQPAFVQLKRDNPDAFRLVGELNGADHIMHQTLFLGTYPGLTPEMLAYEIKVIRDFVLQVPV
jgi:CDP-6-deoxy-D-xylo-4-hexulose-3-dehydrase